ncbi:MAG: hypothetical protein IT393_07005 [Nitrospirae bacterium]|nr:hypothetical protein [Nitrospirota bacterium]
MQLSPYEWIEILRGIGKRLFAEIPAIAGSADAAVHIRHGASGDQTFLIDETAETIIIEALEKTAGTGKGFTLISEECGIKKFGAESDIYILVDPIDGSNNAKRGVPYYAASIAVLDGRRLENLIAGYVLDLSSGKEYWAVKGEGAWCNGTRINCHGTEEFEMVAYEASVPRKDIDRILPVLRSAKKVRCLGATALDLSIMASNAIDLLLVATPARSFDFAAGMLILKEAGGIITDMDGGDISGINAGLERTVPLIAAANRNLHKKAIELIRMTSV